MCKSRVAYNPDMVTPFLPGEMGSTNVWFTNLFLAVISSGSAGGLLPWSQNVHHFLLHLLEDFFKLGIFQNQSLPTRLVVSEQRFIHLTLMAAEWQLCMQLGYRCPTNKTVIWDLVSTIPCWQFCRLPHTPFSIWSPQAIQNINSYEKSKNKALIVPGFKVLNTQFLKD